MRNIDGCEVAAYPAGTRRWINVGLTLVNRLRRWTNVEPTLIPRIVPAAYSADYVNVTAHHTVQTKWVSTVRDGLEVLVKKGYINIDIY